MRVYGSALAAGLLALVGAVGTGQAAELWIMTTMGPSTGVFEVAAGFEKATKNKVTVTFETGPSLEQMKPPCTPSYQPLRQASFTTISGSTGMRPPLRA